MNETPGVCFILKKNYSSNLHLLWSQSPFTPFCHNATVTSNCPFVFRNAKSEGPNICPHPSPSAHISDSLLPPSHQKLMVTPFTYHATHQAQCMGNSYISFIPTMAGLRRRTFRFVDVIIPFPFHSSYLESRLDISRVFKGLGTVLPLYTLHPIPALFGSPTTILFGSLNRRCWLSMPVYRDHSNMSFFCFWTIPLLEPVRWDGVEIPTNTRRDRLAQSVPVTCWASTGAIWFISPSALFSVKHWLFLFWGLSACGSQVLCEHWVSLGLKGYFLFGSIYRQPQPPSTGGLTSIYMSGGSMHCSFTAS